MALLVLLLLLLLVAGIDDLNAFRYGGLRIVQQRSRFSLPTRSATHRPASTLQDLVYVPPDYLLQLVDRHPNQRLSIPDVVEGSGRSFEAVQKDVLSLAALAQAKMEVTKEGEILYSFPHNIQGVVFRRSAARRLQQAVAKAWAALSYVMRISFGAAIITSLAVVTVALVVIALGALAAASGGGGAGSRTSSSTSRRASRSTSSDSEDKKKKDQYRSYSPAINVRINYFDARAAVHVFRGFHALIQQDSRPAHSKLDFLEAIFSVIFGDGNVNKDFDDQAWKQVADVIGSKGGVVAAEEIAALLPCNLLPRLPSEHSSVVVDESWMLPVVLRFNGNPIVTTNGHILYEFKDYKQRQPTQRLTGWHGRHYYPEIVFTLPLEAHQPFTCAEPMHKMGAMFLGLMNLLGVSMLGSMLQHAAVAARHTVIAKMYKPLLLYASAYVTIPLMRYLHNTLLTNRRINLRNKLRQDWDRRLYSGDPLLQEKLNERDALVENNRAGHKRVETTEIIFDSADSPAFNPSPPMP